jgi:predicted DNA-binding transcriptional regulator YafY
MRSEVIRSIAEMAVEENILLDVKYQSEDGEVTERTIESINLERDNVKAWCRTRNEWRTFKLGRIKEVKITNQKFRPQPAETES